MLLSRFADFSREKLPSLMLAAAKPPTPPADSSLSRLRLHLLADRPGLSPPPPSAPHASGPPRCVPARTGSRLCQLEKCLLPRSCSTSTRSHSIGKTWPTPVYTLGREVPPPSFPICGHKKNAGIVICSSQLAGQLLLR